MTTTAKNLTKIGNFQTYQVSLPDGCNIWVLENLKKIDRISKQPTVIGYFKTINDALNYAK